MLYFLYVNPVINLPNVLSTLRIVMIPVLFLLILHASPRNYPVLLVLYVTTVLLDYFDGYFARKLSQETELGKILDPLADKLLTVFVVIGLIVKADFPLWIAVPIFLRDFCILLASLILYKKKHRIRPSILIGKITFFMLSFLIFIYIIDLNQHVDLFIYKRFFAVMTFSFLLWSFYEYYKIYKRAEDEK